MNSKNEITKKDLRLAHSQGNHTPYPIDIETAAWYLATQYPNIKSGNQRKKQKQKADDPQSEHKDNVTPGTAGAHVENNTTKEETTTPNREINLGAHVSETNQAISHTPYTGEKYWEHMI